MTASAEVGRNEALFRSVNDRIRAVSGDLEPTVKIEFVCECSRTDCIAPVTLTLAEYASVRADPAWFAVIPDHLWDANSEHVRAKHDLHWVVEKVGLAAAAAGGADT